MQKKGGGGGAYIHISFFPSYLFVNVVSGFHSVYKHVYVCMMCVYGVCMYSMNE